MAWAWAVCGRLKMRSRYYKEYGFLPTKEFTETACVAALMELYQGILKNANKKGIR